MSTYRRLDTAAIFGTTFTWERDRCCRYTEEMPPWVTSADVMGTGWLTEPSVRFRQGRISRAVDDYEDQQQRETTGRR